MKDIYCRNLPTSTDGSGLVVINMMILDWFCFPLTTQFLLQRVKDVQAADVCHISTQDEDWKELYIYLVILSEAVLILLIILKVWHDQRTFRRTGILPWCSAKMPRLPCDAMLESVKEGPNFHRSAGSAASSNTNVNTNTNISVNQFPMREMRGSGSCGGGSVGSASDRNGQQHFANVCPSSSSRTSSV